MSVADLRERAAVYDLLARFWAGELDAKLYTALTSGELGNAWRGVGGESPSPESLEELQLDYCRLFIGPQGHIPPVQSIWEESRFEGTAANSLRQYHDIVGVDQPFGESLPIDHAANCLALMSQLLLRMEEPDVGDDFAEMTDLAANLFIAHDRWIGELAEAAEQHAGTRFYRDVMTVTQRFLTRESTQFSMRS